MVFIDALFGWHVLAVVMKSDLGVKSPFILSGWMGDLYRRGVGEGVSGLDGLQDACITA